MKVDNINKLIDRLQTETKIGFNMSEFIVETGGDIKDNSGHDCGTVACLAGYAYMIEKPNLKEEEYNLVPSRRFVEVAQDFLGISLYEASRLFIYREYPAETIQSEDVTLEQAIKCLETFRDTGIIDWEKACEPCEPEPSD